MCAWERQQHKGLVFRKFILRQQNVGSSELLDQELHGFVFLFQVTKEQGW